MSDPQVTMARIIAQNVRNRLEPLHGAGEPFAFLTDDQMKRLNIAIRLGIYEALTWMEEGESEYIGWTLAMWPSYAEMPGSPDLEAAYLEFVSGPG